MESTSSVNRAALGNSASLGDLYDARRDDFCGISIFKKAIPATAMTLVDSQFSDVHLVCTDDFSEKVTKLDVSSELQVSVLAGLCTLQGSGRYLSDQKTSDRSVKSSLVYHIKTKQESVNIYHEDLRDAFSIDAIENGMATHVVVAIEWGANSIVSCLYENKENRDVKEISSGLSAQLEIFSHVISGKAKASVEYVDNDLSSGIKFDIRMYGDILPKNGELPTTFEGALDLMKKLPSLVAASNDGKGKQLSYRLIPVSLFHKYLKIEIQIDAVIKTIEERSLVRVVQLFDQMSKAQQQLNDFYQDAFEFKYCMLPEDLKKVTDLKDKMKLQETAFRSELCAVLTQIRSGKADVAQLEKFLESVQASPVSPEMVSATLASWSDVVERINFVRVLVKQGATYIGFGKSLDEELLQNFEAKSYVLYFSQKAKKDGPERWGGNRQLFFQQMKNREAGNKYFVVDCDITPSRKIKSGSSCIQVMQSCQVLIADLLEQQKKRIFGDKSKVIVVSPQSGKVIDSMWDGNFNLTWRFTTNVIVYTRKQSNDWNQVLVPKQLDESGYYTLAFNMEQNSKLKVITVENGKVKSKLLSHKHQQAQQWIIVPTDQDNLFQIISVHTNQALAVTDNVTGLFKEGLKLDLRLPNQKDKAQLFRFDAI